MGFQQLEVAAKLELWKEAYQCIEDIHNSMSPKNAPIPKPSLMKLYYEKLSHIFWHSKNYLFHAYSLSQFYKLSMATSQDSPITPLQKKKLISCVLLATLSIQPAEEEEEDNIFNIENEGNLRLANLLGFKKETPTRTRLAQWLLNRGILRDVFPAVRDLYTLLENTFSPLTMKTRLNSLLARLQMLTQLQERGKEKTEKEKQQKTEQPQQVEPKQNLTFDVFKYADAIKSLAILRLLEQLSRVYKSIRIKKFQSLAPEVNWITIERFITKTVRDGRLKISVDHRSQLLHFHNATMLAPNVRKQLTLLASKLDKIIDHIAPPNPENKARERAQVFDGAKEGVDEEHKRVLQRKDEIEKRKIKHEEELKTKEKEEQDEKEKKAQERKASEAKRLLLESNKRQQERLQQDREAKELASKQALVKTIQNKLEENQSKGKTIKKLRAAINDVQKIDKQAIENAQLELEMKEKLEVQRRLRESCRRRDYEMRAIRMEEKELIIEYEEQQMKKEREIWDEQYKAQVKVRRGENKRDLEIKKRLSRMKEHIEKMREKVMERRKILHAEAYKEFQEKKEQLRI